MVCRSIAIILVCTTACRSVLSRNCLWYSYSKGNGRRPFFAPCHVLCRAGHVLTRALPLCLVAGSKGWRICLTHERAPVRPYHSSARSEERRVGKESEAG